MTPPSVGTHNLTVSVPRIAKSPLSLLGLQKRKRDRELLTDVNFSAEAGQVTALIGPSGSGKSTLLSVFNRLADTLDGLKVTGRVLIGDDDIMNPRIDLCKLRRRVSMVFQRPTPFPLSIRQNLSLPYKECCPGASRAEIDAAIADRLQRVGLWQEVKNRLDDPALRLSGGQQQRLCFARSLMVEPDVLLLDEPCSALDPVSTLAVETVIRSLRSKVTILLVTHNVSQAQRLADQIFVLAAIEENNGSLSGRLIESGPASQVLTRPQHPFTKMYLDL
jgi:phosphate transport system ATP-binding protein